MILFVCNSNREAAALTTVCDHRAWAAYSCTTIREFRSLTAKIHPRTIVVRHRLIDGYSDDIFAVLRETPLRLRPKVIVLMSADRSAQTEARQIALGADCALHDPVRMEVLLAYLAKYRLPAEPTARLSKGMRTSFSIAGVEVYPDEHRIARGKLSHRIAPQEVALLRILSIAAKEVVPYPVLYGELFGRRFDGDTSNCRVLLCKVLASFHLLRVELKPFIQVIPKSGYLYSPGPTKSMHRSSNSIPQAKAPAKRTKFQKPRKPISPNR